MRRILLITICSISLLLGINVLYAQEVSIDLTKATFYPGEDIIAYITVENNYTYPVIWYADYGAFSEDGSLVTERFIEILELETQEEKVITFSQGVFETMPAGLYRIEIILTGDSGELIRIDKTFQISGTKKLIEIKMKICKDTLCSEQSRTFVKNETVYLDYESNTANLMITAKLIYPDTTEQQVALPTSIAVGQIGTHILELTAYKEGYRTLTKKTLFAVIEKEADIPIIQICNANGICDDNENHENCPQDCPPICKGDFDQDGDVDGSDLAVFAADFGRINCSPYNICEGDFDQDGDVDGSDLIKFSIHFGRTNCPIPE